MSGLSFLFTSLFLFFIGAVVGSFLNVLIERSIEGKDWLKGRSRCDFCGHQLAWYDNIPLLSYLLLRGRCRYCHKKIHPSHILMEVLTGALFVWWFWGGFVLLNVFRLTQQPFVFIQPLFWLLVSVLLLIIFIYDLKYLIIPESSLWLLLATVLVYRFSLVLMGIMCSSDLTWSLVAAALAAGALSILWLITKGRGIGLGDVKLVIPLSLLVGWQLTLVALVLAFIIGAVISVILLIFEKVSFGRPVPFGPYLIIGFALTLVLGHPLLDWYLSML